MEFCRSQYPADMKTENRPSESFITGVIAVVFLIIGLQVAMFIHRAAVVKIAAGRDEPDTVYVYQSHGEDSSEGYGIKEERYVRNNSIHSERAEAVREKTPRRKVESFRFDPNTVSVDDLCRLGFTFKQAQSIDNYRKKGGRFRRKADFARSYVVSDSIYRRLESFIDIPLVDLNAAVPDSLAAGYDCCYGRGRGNGDRCGTHRDMDRCGRRAFGGSKDCREHQIS